MASGHKDGPYQNVLLNDRAYLAPQKSMQKLIDYSLIQDARSRSRRQTHYKASFLVTALVFAYPTYYFVRGTFFGVWGELRKEDGFTSFVMGLGKPLRLQYRPEIYFRDQDSFLRKVEEENLQKIKEGKAPAASTQLVLWH